MTALVPGRLLYLRTPHTASTAVENAIVRGIPGAVVVVPGHARLADFDRGITRLKDGRPVSIGGEVVATTVRNPYDMIVTWWISNTAKRVLFSEFIRDFNGPKQVVGGRIFSRADEADIVLRHETLDRDFADMLRLLRLPSVELSRDNVTPSKKGWRTYYDEESFTIVNERFGCEIEDYGYKCTFR